MNGTRYCPALHLAWTLTLLVSFSSCGGGPSNNAPTGTNSGGTNNGTNTGTNNSPTSNTGSGTPAPGTPSIPASPEYLFWANPTTGVIVTYSIDANSGSLTLNNTVQTNLNPLFVISSDPAGKFLYASGISGNSTSDDTIAYAIDHATGKLSQVTGSPFKFGVFFVNQVSSANYLYGADNITNQIHTIAIDSSTGALTRLVASTPTGGDNPYSPRLDAAHNLLAVANQSSNTVSVFNLDTATGVPKLAAGAPFGSPISGATDCPPKGGCGSDVAFVNGFLYYANAALAQSSQAGSGIVGYSIAPNGSLTTLSSSPFSNPSFAPQTIAVTPDSRFLYVANAGGGVVAYSAASTGTLTLVTATPYNGSGYVTIDPSGKFLYVSDTTYTHGILGYSIDSTTGALTPISGTPVGAGVQGGQIVIR